MKILLVNPSCRIDFTNKENYFPSFDQKIETVQGFYDRLLLKLTPQKLNFPILSAVTPEEHSIEIVNENRREINYDGDYDLVGISAVTIEALNAYKIADRFRERGKKVILGGWHPSALPEEAKQHADSVVIGEAEEIWPHLLKDFEEGKLKAFYKPDKPVDLAKIPQINRDSKEESYFLARVQATRGCPYGCEFCAITNSPFGSKFRMRPIEHVIEEISSIPQKFLSVIDPSLTINPSYTKSLFKEMKDLNKKFFCFGNISYLGKDEELLKLSSEAGCLQWEFGIESIVPESLKSVGKNINKVSEYDSAIKKIRDYGISTHGNMIFGFDGDTPDVFDATLNAIYSWDIDSIAFNILTPLPGTPLYHNMEKEERILTKDWSRYNFWNVVFQPKHMTREELFKGTLRVAVTLNSYSRRIREIAKGIKLGFYPFLRSAILNKLE